MNSALDIAKNMSITHNVSINVYDEITGQLIKHHEGHNAATNSMLVGIGHYLLGDGVLNQGHDLLERWIPKYISLGTMGLYNQEEDAQGLPEGIGFSPSYSEVDNFKYYMNHTPGFGADGYDSYLNPDGEHGYVRPYMGLGPIFTDRNLFLETMPARPHVTVYQVSKAISEIVYVKVIGRSSVVDKTDSVTIDSEDPTKFVFETVPGPNRTIEIKYRSITNYGYELTDDSFPRFPISYRRIIPEDESENPKTIDLIFSAMISTGALKKFREPGKDYIFISEAGLWSNRSWPTDESGNIDYNAGENGLLAGYRIFPPDDSQQDMEDPINRKILKEQILRVGYNQVVQVVWKIQLGSVYELFTTHPEKEPITWEGFT